MIQQSFINRPPLEVWQVETLRMTGFPSPAAPIAASTWWKDLVGEEPETRVLQPRRGGHQEEGVLDNGKLVLVIQPARVDWLFTVADAHRMEGQSIPAIGLLPQALDTFRQLMLRWFALETCPSLIRLAFGTVLLQPVEDRPTGYRRLAAYLSSVTLDPEGASDFLYQINRPRESTAGITGLRINRLSKWSVALHELAAFSFAPATVTMSTPLVACRLELDINTAPDFQGELARPQLPHVFHELVHLGQEIASEGDIP